MEKSTKLDRAIPVSHLIPLADIPKQLQAEVFLAAKASADSLNRGYLTVEIVKKEITQWHLENPMPLPKGDLAIEAVGSIPSASRRQSTICHSLLARVKDDLIYLLQKLEPGDFEWTQLKTALDAALFRMKAIEEHRPETTRREVRLGQEESNYANP